MKGLILIPETFKDKAIPLSRYLHLFSLIMNKLNFDYLFTDDIDPNKIDADVVVTFKSPQKQYVDLMRSMRHLPKSKKLIGYHTDIHGRETYKDFVKPMSKLLERADKILCPYNYAFKKTWPEYSGKCEFFPHFYVPYEKCRGLKINTKPIMKCLLSGIIDKEYYPLREYIYKNKNAKVDVLWHPLYQASTGFILNSKEYKIDAGYIWELHKYFCCVATSSKVDYAVAKYFEIPFSGSLLLANYTPDLDRLGFVNGKHYVAITKENFFRVLDDVLGNPERYEQIRREGRDFVLNNFSILDRFAQFKNILNSTGRQTK